MRSQFPQTVVWIDKISLHKWSQAYDGGHRCTHMITNLAECMNSVLKGARSLPICALLKITFQNINIWFVERGLKAHSMLRAGHQYLEDDTALLQQNHQKSAYCYVQRYDRDNSEFEVQEILSPHQYRPKPISFTVRLNDWWCDCGHLQASRLPYHHVIVVCSFGHMPLSNFIDPVYSLDYINKAYQVQFHPLRNEDYWSTYTGPNFIPDPQTRRKASGRATTTRIHNEMDHPITDKPKICFYCRTEGHHRGQCPFC